MTPAETLMWARLRNHQLGFHIRRQHVVLGRFIADFCCAAARLCIEIDGDTHTEPDQAEYDLARSTCLETRGFHVIRFTNAEVHRDLEAVLQILQETCRPRTGITYDGPSLEPAARPEIDG
jgi:very-short-patch-repair endonuclease